MRKFLTTALAVALTWAAASAVPAKPGQNRTVMQSDGTSITLHMVGDEWHHSWVTADGKPVIEAANGDMVYRTADGASNIIAHETNARTLSEQSFLSINASQMTAKAIMAKSPRARAGRENAARNMAKPAFRSSYSAVLNGANGPRKAAGDPQVATVGSPRVPVILVQYSDKSFSNTKAQIQEAYTSESTSKFSALRYFKDQSNGMFTPQFEFYGPYTLNSTRVTYGGNSTEESGSDQGVAKMVGEAIDKAGNDITWTNYDNDKDGEADVVIVIYAGVGEAQASSTVPESVWPCQWTLSNGKRYGDGTGTRTRNGVTIDAFGVFNEINGDSDSGTSLDGVGTYCHEFGHVMGLPDFYETTYKNGYYGMGYWDIMCSGSYNNNGYCPVGYNAYEKEFMGWHTPSTPVENHNYTLPKWNTGNDVSYKVTSPLNNNECYYLENRVKQGWDKYIDDEGMLVTHLTYVASRWSDNSPNDEAVQLFTIIPADNKLSINNETADCFGETNHALTDDSTPAAKLNMYADGSRASTTGGAGYMQQPLTEININSSDKSVTFWYMKGSTTPLDAPVLADASNVTTNGWTASWGAVTGAATYELQIDPASGGGGSTTPILSDSFNKATTASSDQTSDISNNLDNYTNISGWSGTKVFQAANDGFRIGNSSTAGVLTTPALDLSSSGGKVTVKFNAKKYNNDNTLSLKCGSSTSVTKTLTDNAADYIAVLDCSAATNQKISFTGSNRAYIYNVEVYAGDASSALSSAPRRAGATSRTITGITGTSYNVTGMADDTNYTFKVRAVPATTDAEHSTGDWSNVKTVKTIAADPEPFIMADETKSFNAFVGQSSTADVEIAYEDLSANITATITGDNASMFSCTSPITIDSSGDGYATLTVTYSPTAAGTHTATLTLSSTGADPVTCTLTGTATLAPLATYNPVMQDATGVTTSAFTATWTDQTDDEAVASYTLQISKKPETTTTTVNDVLNNGNTINETTTNYSSWTATGTSGAVYSGQSAGGSGTIQLRSNNSNSGIVSTTSGGKIRKVTVAWGSGNTSGRKLDVYGSNTAFESPTNLYNTTATKLGSIEYDSQTELTISGDYAYIGVRSNSGAMYLDKITFSWEQTTASSAPRRTVSDTGNADSGVRTITGITSKSYEVTGLTAGATYEYKVKAIYTDRAEAAESAWSATRTVTLPESTNPRFTFTTTALAFASDNNSSDTKAFTLTGEYLTAGVELAITGTDAALFSVSPATITPTDGNVNAEVTVTYTPTTAGNHSATLTVSSTGAKSKTIALTGTATLFKGILTLNNATSVGSTRFTATWDDTTMPVANVKSYTLWVNKTSGGEEPAASYTKLGDYSFASGVNSNWTKTSGYAAVNNTEGATQLGSSKQSCVLTSPSFNFTGYTKATIVVNAKYYGDENSSMKLTLGSYSETFSLSDAYVDYVKVVDISGERDLSSLQATIECTASSKRIYLKNVTIYAGDASSALSAPRRAVATNGDADNGGLTVTGITDKFYTVEDLTPGATYEFKVKTVYSDDTESAWSNVEEVTLNESSDPRLSVDPLALAFTNVTTGATEQKTFTVTGTNLTGDVTVAVGEGMFTVTPATISAADAAEGATVTVTYAPTAFGNHTATVTLTSAGAEAVSVELSGSAVLEKAVPVLAEAANVTATSFQAVWTDATPAANVRDYTLYVNKTADPVTPGDDDELVTLIDGSAGVREWTSTGKVTTNSVDEPYLQLGTSKGIGGVESDEFTLDAAGKVTVVVVAKPFANDVSKNVPIKVSVGTSNQTFTLGTTGNDETLVAVLDAVAGTNTVSVDATTQSSRPWVKSVMVYKGDVSAQLAAAGASRRAVATDGDADNSGLTVTGITEKNYTVTGLTPGATYEFYVEANYVDNSKSEARNHEEVTLPAGTTLADVLESESGSYTVSDDMVIVAVKDRKAYATNGTDWLPIQVESNDNFEVGDKITLVQGTFNGSNIAPLFTMTACDESSADIDYTIEDFYLGQNQTGTGPDAIWERMPAAGEVVYVHGYFFLENEVPTLRGYSGMNGGKGRSLILQGDVNLTEGILYKVELCVQLAEAWSGAPRRIASTDANAFQNLHGEFISAEDLTYTGINDLDAGREPVKRQYVNAAGAVSDQPYDGFNIVVTTWSDGSTTAVKVAH